jgi:hypothetical protein
MYPLPRKGLAHPCGIAIDLYHGIAPGQQIALKLGGYTKGEGIEAGVAPRIRLGLTDQHRRQKIERIKASMMRGIGLKMTVCPNHFRDRSLNLRHH